MAKYWLRPYIGMQVTAKQTVARRSRPKTQDEAEEEEACCGGDPSKIANWRPSFATALSRTGCPATDFI